MKYDLIIFGGGTSGVSCAYQAGMLGIKTLVIEKSDVLGGAITQGLVTPCMKLETNGINIDFYNKLIEYSKVYNAQYTYIDGNTGWFNPELLKIIFDKMLNDVGVDVIFSSEAFDIKKNDQENSFNIQIKHKILSLCIEAKYIVDATANGEIFKLLNFEFQNDNDKRQAASLRFILGGINLNIFSSWLKEFDTNRDVTTVDDSTNEIHLSTAFTWDKAKNWALTPIFEQAVKDGVLEVDDCAYFQVFTVPGMPNSLTFNAPRIILDESEDINTPFVYSKALSQGRKRIYRLYKFCKKYFIGFENCYISHISDTLGVRESYRIKGKHTYTKNDILTSNNFDNIAFCSNYPIDIHSNTNNDDKLIFSQNTYSVPIETLKSSLDENVYGIGRIISSDFEAQAAIRTQINCFSMGEAVAKDIHKKLK